MAAQGKIPADLVIKNGRLVNVFTGTVNDADVAVYDGVVVGIGSAYHGREEVEAQGKWIVPGLIDGHYHIESSMLLPSQLSRALLPHGTTALVSDPHEIANVMGLKGIQYLSNDSAGLPFDVFFTAPSCVPATHLETAGDAIGLPELAVLKQEPRVIGLGEMMNYPGILKGEEEILEKLLLYQDLVLDGHAPGLRGRDLQGYIAAGIRSDHETTDCQEAAEKLQSGMMIFIREGSSAKNLEALSPLVKNSSARRFCLVSDDLEPRDIAKHGHLDFVIRKAIEGGIAPPLAVQMCTLNPAEFYRLWDRGALGPGYRADLLLLGDLEHFRVEKVFKDGLLVAEGGECTVPSRTVETIPQSPLNTGPLSVEKFRIPARAGRGRIIQVVPGQILTGSMMEEVKVQGPWVTSDPERDLIKLAVVERHHGTGRVGLGMVSGFGLKRGALATSVSHDSHNIIVLGENDEDLTLAVQTVCDMGGGMAVTKGGKVAAKTPLAVGGLMSTAPVGRLVAELDELYREAAALPCKIDDPFAMLSFLALPVIPELKLTDFGLVDVPRFTIVPFFVEDEGGMAI
jgi:adenine deaminase